MILDQEFPSWSQPKRRPRLLQFCFPNQGASISPVSFRSSCKMFGFVWAFPFCCNRGNVGACLLKPFSFGMCHTLINTRGSKLVWFSVLTGEFRVLTGLLFAEIWKHCLAFPCPSQVALEGPAEAAGLEPAQLGFGTRLCPPLPHGWRALCAGLSAHPRHLWLLSRHLPRGPWKHGRRQRSAPSRALPLHRSKVFLGSCKLRAENSQCGFTSCSGDPESRPWSTAALLGAAGESLSAQPVLRSLLAGAGAPAQQRRVTTLPAEACNCLAGDTFWAKVNALVSCKGTRDGAE